MGSQIKDADVRRRITGRTPKDELGSVGRPMWVVLQTMVVAQQHSRGSPFAGDRVNPVRSAGNRFKEDDLFAIRRPAMHQGIHRRSGELWTPPTLHLPP